MKNMKSLGLLSAFIGILLYRIIGFYYGASSLNLIVYVCLSIALFVIICLVLNKYFIVAFSLLLIVIPLVIMTVGMYLDNFLLMSIGLILLFIVLFVLIRVAPYLGKYNNK